MNMVWQYGYRIDKKRVVLFCLLHRLTKNINMVHEQAVGTVCQIYSKKVSRPWYLNSFVAHGISYRMVIQFGIGASVYVGLRPSLQAPTFSGPTFYETKDISIDRKT
jgi:hypothetical protein